MKNNIFKQSIILLKDNIMVIQPLFFGILIMMLLVTPLSIKNSFDLSVIYTLIICILCLLAFLAGWYNCIKTTIGKKNLKYDTPEARNQASLDILKSFFPGVGEYMLPLTVVGVIYFIFATVAFLIYRFVALKLFVMNNLPKDFLNVVNTSSQSEIAKYIQDNFSSEQVQTLIFIFVIGFIIYFLFNILVLWFGPSIYYSDKNPFRAIVQAIKFSGTHFLMSAWIILVMFLLNIILSLSNNLVLINQHLAFIPMLFSFFYCMYYVLTVFLYYEQETQNNSDNRPECDGQI